MSTEKAAGAEEATRCREMYERLGRLTIMRLQDHVSEDPSRRLKFLTDIENGRVLARVELNAFSRILTEVLGVEGKVFLRYLSEELEAEINRLVEELQVKGWDGLGNPVRGR
ncbi:hypothetical protein LCGC14_0744500 [marine sediment metagenome]|uniref:Uncharacterized protein n=1 Tax=marine sediment metagenome TaxID=412755 RepID=A0A0F9Q5U6_9ZZZZ